MSFFIVSFYRFDNMVYDRWVHMTWVLSLGWEECLGGGNSNLLQYSCQENPMDRGAWWATVQRVTKSWT